MRSGTEARLEATQGYVAGFSPLLNIRELGGIEAADGRRVRSGLFFRGSALSVLNDLQRTIVDGFGLTRIIDLRATAEARGKDDYVPEGTEYLLTPGMYDANGDEMDFSPAGIERMNNEYPDPMLYFRELYVSMAHGNPAMHAVVESMVEGKAPLYFHCSAGKDRTGVAAAIILSILGVNDEAILENYLLTNLYRAELIDNPPAVLPPFIESVAIWQRANSVDGDDLRAVLASMDEGVSSREEYFAKEFGLDAETLAELRDRYLE